MSRALIVVDVQNDDFCKGGSLAVTSWPPHCRAGSPGASFHPALDVSGIEAVFDKGAYTSAYSGFEGADRGETGTPLGDWLDAHGVDTVEVVGLATDHCVRATALDAGPARPRHRGPGHRPPADRIGRGARFRTGPVGGDHRRVPVASPGCPPPPPSPLATCPASPS